MLKSIAFAYPPGKQAVTDPGVTGQIRSLSSKNMESGLYKSFHSKGHCSDNLILSDKHFKKKINSEFNEVVVEERRSQRTAEASSGQSLTFDPEYTVFVF
ncbi:hypothetical protein EVAR_65050_1 [Eumeta japonica]|uniref:Uncharacterized protein n=1 Tax=Eumeta variegata TaxID=151549 RepID=A0A4C1ZQM4_EUMVA|nr:hypothetical protein EVAR_65050_1 [Eumeta japonica]